MSDTFLGHDLETGVLQRVRRWRDALPVLVLVDALRVAGSPLYVSMSLAAVLVTRVILWGPVAPLGSPPGALASLFADGMAVHHVLEPLAAGMSLVTDFRWLGSVHWLDIVRLLIVLGVWALPATTLARAGACYAAGRDQSFLQNAALACKRLPWVWLVAVVPAASAVGLSAVMVAVGLVTRAGPVGMWLGEFAAVLTLPIMVLVGLIAAGAFAAVPLAWAAMVIEKPCDTFDSLSRGYEYLYRRPVHLLLYSLCGYGLIGIVFVLAIAVSSAAMVLGTLAARFGSGSESVPYAFQLLVGHLPLAVAASALWGLIGATYLLMRQSANQQEIEDVAISPVDRREAELPTLQTSPADAQR